MSSEAHIVRLERELLADIAQQDPARLERARKLIRDHLDWEVQRLTKKQDADTATLIQEYAKVELLRRLIEHPEKFTLREMKDLYKGSFMGGEVAEMPREDPIAFIKALPIPPERKAALLEEVLRTARARLDAPR